MPDARVVPDADRNLSTVVIEAVAEAKGVSPTDVQPLHYSVDADALDDLFQSNRGSHDEYPLVSFTYAGCEIAIRGGESIVVRELDDEAEQFE